MGVDWCVFFGYVMGGGGVGGDWYVVDFFVLMGLLFVKVCYCVKFVG